MSQDHWETPLGISSTQGVGIGVANGSGDDLPGRQEKKHLSVGTQLEVQVGSKTLLHTILQICSYVSFIDLLLQN